MERDRVEKELCVQRLVKEEVRTCHGQCYLMKRLNRSEQRAQDLPQQLRSLKLGDMTVDTITGVSLAVEEFASGPWAEQVNGVLAGHCALGEPVPWA